ncbi:MAG: hypothetical protein ACK52P_18845 [Alphaproteobacteria bacterium]
MDRLTNEGKRNTGLAIAVHGSGIAHDAAGGVNTQIAGPRKLAGNQRIARCIGRRQRHGEGGKKSVTSQGGFEALIRQSGA